LDERAQEDVLHLRRGGEADLDLFEAEPHQKLEELRLLREIHRLDESLVAVAKVDAAPRGRARQGAPGPGPVAKIHPPKRKVLLSRHFTHGNLSISLLRFAGPKMPTPTRWQFRLPGQECVLVVPRPRALGNICSGPCRGSHGMPQRDVTPRVKRASRQ